MRVRIWAVAAVAALMLPGGVASAQEEDEKSAES